MTRPGDIVATCRVSLDGYMVLGEERMTLDSRYTAPESSTYSWRFPLGFGGLHFVGVDVSFKRAES